MARYHLTVTHKYEDNEETQSDSEIRKYMQNVVETSIAGWDHVEATLIVNRMDSYIAKLASPDNLLKLKRIAGWPWHCSADSVPTPEDIHVIACKWSEDLQTWIDYDIYEFDSDKQAFIDDHEIATELYPSPNVWWRTVAEPEPLDKLSYERNRQEMSEAAKG